MAKGAVRLSRSAATWLRQEIAYLAERSPAAAERLVERIRQARQSLSDHPRIGQPGHIPGTRRLVIGDHVLTVRVVGADVEIAAIRHARQRDAYAPADLLTDGDDEAPSPKRTG